MPFLYVLSVIFGLILGLLTLAAAELFLLAILGAANRNRRNTMAPPRDERYLVLIPAHDEGAGIAATVASALALEPAGAADVVVIADNCTDDTAARADEAGARVLVRTDPEHRGKGYALRWALEQIPLDDVFAVMVLDADCGIDPNALAVCNASLHAGYGAVQIGYDFVPRPGYPLSYLQHMAAVTEDVFFHQGRARAGLPVLLRGTGMCFGVGTLRNHPWRSTSITEDVDHAVDLVLAGVRIDSSLTASVHSAATTRYEQDAVQKQRWAAGTLQLIRERVPQLLRESFRQGRPELVEFACSLFLLSRPALILLALFVALDAWLLPIPRGGALALWGLVLALFYTLYLLGGILFARDRGAVIRALITLPRYVVAYLRTRGRAARDHRSAGWDRTTRD